MLLQRELADPFRLWLNEAAQRALVRAVMSAFDPLRTLAIAPKTTAEAASMHAHLLKPLHGWRAFVGEVGIIVVGVLIA